MSDWATIWMNRQFDNSGVVAASDGALLEASLRLNGYDSPMSTAVTPAAMIAFAQRWACQVGVVPGQSVAEVGCGSGAFLVAIDSAVSGLELRGWDLSATLVGHGRSLFPHLVIDSCPADKIPLEVRADHLLSFGAFHYFPNLDYAERVIRRMAIMARRSVSIFDLPDAALRHQTEADQRATLSPEDAARYAGLHHLYYEREWLSQILGPGWAVDTTDQDLAGYGNAKARFNVVARRENFAE